MKQDKVLAAGWFFLALGIGGLLTYAGLTASPEVCRQVVLRDVRESGAYTAQLSAILPDATGSDFVKALTKGK